MVTRHIVTVRMMLSNCLVVIPLSVMSELFVEVRGVTGESNAVAKLVKSFGRRHKTMPKVLATG